MTIQSDSASGNRFEVRDRVRWNDCDPFGIIYYGAYVRFFQVAEEELFRACGLPFEQLRKNLGVWIPRKALHAEFHSPAELDEEVAVQAWFARVGTTSITLQFEVYRASDRAHRATGSLAVVSVDKTTMKKKAIPEEVRQKLAPYTA
ncbi:MAG TPA: thioesterase family protein [Gemmatimonadaceae bacterium]|nr:thioesterase family protein [Gemmatimonadaceae bacterium]